MSDADLVRAAAMRIGTPESIARIDELLAELPAYRRFVADATDREPALRGIASLGESLTVFLRWFIDGEGPTDEQRARLRDIIALRAAEGRDEHDGRAVFRRAVEAGSEVMLTQASDAERAALATRMPIVFGWLGLIDEMFREVYAEHDDPVVSRTEQLARSLLGRLLADGVSQQEASELAAAVGVTIPETWHACVLTVAGASTVAHAELAARLRERGVLAIFDGPWVVAAGLQVDPAAVGFTDRFLLVRAPGPVLRAELGVTIDDLHLVGRMARDDGRRGVVTTDAYLCDLVLARAPRPARRMAERVYGPLVAGRRGDLVVTVDALVDHGFERSAAAAALPVHRNTMAQRISRIETLTGLDLDARDDRLLIALARRLRARS